MKADIVVFDPTTVHSPATRHHPRQYPTGIEHVLVNGQPVVTDGNPHRRPPRPLPPPRPPLHLTLPTPPYPTVIPAPIIPESIPLKVRRWGIYPFNLAFPTPVGQVS